MVSETPNNPNPENHPCLPRTMQIFFYSFLALIHQQERLSRKIADLLLSNNTHLIIKIIAKVPQFLSVTPPSMHMICSMELISTLIYHFNPNPKPNRPKKPAINHFNLCSTSMTGGPYTKQSQSKKPATPTTTLDPIKKTQFTHLFKLLLQAGKFTPIR